MPEVNKIVYKGKEIIFVDYRGCTDEKDTINISREATRVITSSPKGSLVLINFEDAYQTPNFKKEVEQQSHQTQNFVKKRAIVVKINAPRLILLNAFNRLLGKKQLKPFKALKEAKEWLVT